MSYDQKNQIFHLVGCFCFDSVWLVDDGFLCRCELLVFCGGVHQKIASGLFEPFVSHLKFLKDEISKGGYSIKLLPPNHGGFWFTRATFERSLLLLLILNLPLWPLNGYSSSLL